jgi:hypothetical protein
VAHGGKAKDWELIARLLAELRDSPWASPPPLELADRVASADRTLRREAAGRQLGDLIAPFHKAVADADIPAALKQEDTLLAALKRFGLTEDDQLAAAFDQPRRELRTLQKDDAKRKQFRADVRELDKALAEGVDWWFVKQCHLNASLHRWPLPRDVGEAFARRRRKEWLTRGAIAGGGLVLVGGLVAGFFIAAR